MPSTVVAAIKYYPEKKVLRVIYVSGSVYDYKDVPENVYVEMKVQDQRGAT
jgi:hypothetical protein